MKQLQRKKEFYINNFKGISNNQDIKQEYRLMICKNSILKDDRDEIGEIIKIDENHKRNLTLYQG